ncbi:hypothetical protein [Bradyrhizobium sp. JR19.8]|uniref:hypothetical protein n=1 Tax=Bradyrhizobium sp. JR19.8 TaxID=3156370 RepID=UPI003391FE4C
MFGSKASIIIGRHVVVDANGSTSINTPAIGMPMSMSTTIRGCWRTCSHCGSPHFRRVIQGSGRQRFLLHRLSNLPGRL